MRKTVKTTACDALVRAILALDSSDSRAASTSEA